jgi:hypothetical protein
MDAGTADFARFYEVARDDCLRTVLASVGDQDRKELTDEAFARAWACWRKVGRHPAPRAWIVRTALNAGVSAWRRSRREVPLDAAACPAEATAGGLVDLDIMAALRRLPERQPGQLAGLLVGRRDPVDLRVHRPRLARRTVPARQRVDVQLDHGGRRPRWSRSRPRNCPAGRPARSRCRAIMPGCCCCSPAWQRCSWPPWSARPATRRPGS